MCIRDRRAPAQAVIDLTAIRSNVAALAGHAPTAQVMAVIKADGYGHGLLPSAWAALAGGATWLGVAQATEALELRAGGITARVLTWLYSADAALDELLEADIDVSVSGALSLNQVLDAVRATGRTARVHVKVDTGLGRSGVPPRELASLLAAAVAAQAEGMLEVVGIWSHLAWADAPDHPTVLAQGTAFAEAVALAENAGAHLQVRPGVLGERDSLGEGGPLGQHGRVVGRVGPGQVRPDPDHLEHAIGLRGHRRSQQRRQLAGRHAAPPKTGVHLHVHPSGAARRAYGVQHLTERQRPAHRQVDVGLEQLVEGRIGGVQPGQHAGRDPAGAQLERLGRLRDAEPGGAAGQSRPGARQQ